MKATLTSFSARRILLTEEKRSKITVWELFLSILNILMSFDSDSIFITPLFIFYESYFELKVKYLYTSLGFCFLKQTTYKSKCFVLILHINYDTYYENIKEKFMNGTCIFSRNILFLICSSSRRHIYSSRRF